MKVNECMCKKVVWAKQDATVYDVAKLMSENNIGCVPICNDTNNVIGLITDRDITLRAVAEGKDTKQLKAQDIMSTKIYKVEDTVDVTEASKLMCDCQVKRVPVTSNNAIVGIITLADLTNNHANISDQEITTTLKRICDWH